MPKIKAFDFSLIANSVHDSDVDDPSPQPAGERAFPLASTRRKHELQRFKGLDFSLIANSVHDSDVNVDPSPRKPAGERAFPLAST